MSEWGRARPAHNVYPTAAFPTSHDVMENALSTLTESHPELKEIPLQYAFKLRDTASVCTLRLQVDISNLDIVPCPDLLDLWIKPLSSIDPEWVVDWACAAANKDRRLWVSVKGLSRKFDREMAE